MRLIDADALKKVYDGRYETAFMQSKTRVNAEWGDGFAAGVNWARNELTDTPTIEARPVVRGRWGNPIKVDADNNGYKCSECGEFGAPCWNFCPNCGADMRGDAND